MIERKILFRIALTRAPYDQIRPYSFSKIRSKCWPPQYNASTPQNHHKNPPPGGRNMFTGRKKGNSQLVLFVLDSFANRIYWNFPFFRQVASHSRIQTKGQKAGPHMFLNCWVFWVEHPWICSGFLGEHLARVESSGD